MAKRLQLLREALPTASRVAVLRLVGHLQDVYVTEIEAGAQQLGIRLQIIEIRRPEDLSGAFQAAVRGGAQAVMMTQGPFFAENRAQLAELAVKHRLPSLSGEAPASEAGALLFYGPDIYEGCQRAATYVDRILKGGKPADLPVEQPTKYELVINLGTANRSASRSLRPCCFVRTGSANDDYWAPRDQRIARGTLYTPAAWCRRDEASNSTLQRAKARAARPSHPSR